MKIILFDVDGDLIKRAEEIRDVLEKAKITTDEIMVIDRKNVSISETLKSIKKEVELTYEDNHTTKVEA